MKVLLTGSSGFVGKQLAKIYPDCRHVVRKGRNCEFKNVIVVDNIDGNVDWDGCFDDIDTIIHLASIAHRDAISTEDYKEVNTYGTLHLASEAVRAGVKRFVFVSSIGVNGTSTYKERFSVKSLTCPHNAYAQSKYEAELGLKRIAEQTGLEVVIVRPTLVYGLDAPGNFGMLTRLVDKFLLLPFGLANNRKDFIAVQNLVDLLNACAEHPSAPGHVFLASDGETVSIKQFTNAIAEGLGKKVIQLPIPVILMRLAGRLIGKSSMIEQLYGNLEVDSSNIKEVLGWTPPLTMNQAMATLRDSGVNTK
ncbi:NAD-dependent epimerase/dehydratase family protein [Vibrio penaeicida]|uniref:NAD-dependent epimerase/dehydratase family protein n=1 Tax=Vibrio penaeicida TaxID=104609 RepID=UPI0027371408|nr:NAD-dependent epimerase/dehydratase family protein [Vibrio penaeicida]MDP2573134.1 NAD-dependent epimerase/dehydratase family protein [Vibrio penaeicida]